MSIPALFLQDLGTILCFLGHFLRSFHRNNIWPILLTLILFTKRFFCVMRARVPARNLRLIALIFLTIITPFIYAAPASTNNTEVPLSISCTKQENSTRSVCCRPSKWTDILIFYTSNYFAHAATTRTQPGQSTWNSLLIPVIALLFPMSGALRGIRAIASRATFADTELQTAARAGALCMVVKVPKSNMEELSSG